MLAAGLFAFAAPAVAGFPAAIQLADLDGTSGFVINGAAVGHRFGESVSGAGDVNGDGIADLIVSAHGADPNGEYSGAIYVVFGRNVLSSGGFPGSIELSSLNGRNGFVINGEGADEPPNDALIGISVSGAGDINGDGIDDLIIGIPRAGYQNYWGVPGGVSYVVFGRDVASEGDFPAVLELSSLDGSNGFLIHGSFENSSAEVSGVGDVNGDGIADVIVNAPFHNMDRYGAHQIQAHVMFGRDTAADGDFPASIFNSQLRGSIGFSIDGFPYSYSAGWSGLSVSDAGDINGDGIGDLIVGSPGEESAWYPNRSGTSHVVFGRDVSGTAGFPDSVDVTALDGSDGFSLFGEDDYDYFGASVSSAGDINGDGVDDLLIGAPYASPNGLNSGASYVVFGRRSGSGGRFPAELDMSALNGSNGFVINGQKPNDFVGFSVSDAGDFNGDGIADLVVGSLTAVTGALSDEGVSFVLFGRDTGSGGNFPADLDLWFSDSSEGVALIGGVYDLAGVSVSAAGDVNGDGIDDLIIGAPSASPNGDNSGASYVVFGRPDDSGPVLVRALGDINGDNKADLARITAAGHVRIKGLNGKMVSEFGFSHVRRVSDVEVLPDINGNGAPELAALGSGSTLAEVRDTLTGEQLNKVWFNRYWQPLDLEVVSDHSGNGKPELAHLAENVMKVSVKDAAMSKQVKNLNFSEYFHSKDLEVYPDLNRNGADDMAVLGDNKNPAKSDKIEVRDLRSGAKLKNIWLGSGWQALQNEVIADNNRNGFGEHAVLRKKNAGPQVTVMIRDGKTGKTLKTLWFDKNYPPTHLLKLGDQNRNGSNELAVFGRRFDGSNQKAQIKDSKTGATLRQVWFSKWFPAEDVTVSPDINGNRAEELVLLGRHKNNGSLKAFVKDSKTGVQLGAVSF